MESMQLRPIEKAKISCAKKLFNQISTEDVVYHDVDSYQSLLNIMPTIDKKIGNLQDIQNIGLGGNKYRIFKKYMG